MTDIYKRSFFRRDHSLSVSSRCAAWSVFSTISLLLVLCFIFHTFVSVRTFHVLHLPLPGKICRKLRESAGQPHWWILVRSSMPQDKRGQNNGRAFDTQVIFIFSQTLVPFLLKSVLFLTFVLFAPEYASVVRCDSEGGSGPSPPNSLGSPKPLFSLQC